MCKYIDQISSCSTNVKENEIEFVKLQKHKHSKTCKKRKRGVTKCHFGAPWPPMEETKILHPLEDSELNNSEKNKEIYETIQVVLNDISTESQIIHFEQFLQKLQIDTKTYILALCSSLSKPKIFLKRNFSDIFTNSYMNTMLSVWKANHDIQFVLDAYSCVVHICDYMTKSQKGMSKLLEAACEEAKKGNMTLRQSV